MIWAWGFSGFGLCKVCVFIDLALWVLGFRSGAYRIDGLGGVCSGFLCIDHLSLVIICFSLKS